MSDYYSSSEDIELEDIEDEPNVVIDAGSHSIKAGFCYNDTPQTILPSIVARPRSNLLRMNSMGSSKQLYIGDEAKSKRGIMALEYPMKDILYNINNIQWDDIEAIYKYTFTKLHLQPENLSQQTILLTESPLNPRTNRRKIVEIMFETFDVDSMYLANQSVLSLYGTDGTTTGIVVDCGHNASHIVPVYEGDAIQHATLRLNIAGKHLTTRLSTLLQTRGYSFKSEIVQEIKETLAKCAVNYEHELKTETTVAAPNYELPDGKIIEITSERFKCGEILFKPFLIGKDIKGIHELVNESIMQCNKDIKEELYENIVLSGGTGMLSGFDKRLNKEITNVLPQKHKLRIINAKPYSAFIGGTILSSLPMFMDMCISQDEYDDYGSRIVHTKCF